MIKVTVGTNTKRVAVMVEHTDTLRSVLEEQEIDYSTGTLHLDGTTITPGQLD